MLPNPFVTFLALSIPSAVSSEHQELVRNVNQNNAARYSRQIDEFTNDSLACKELAIEKSTETGHPEDIRSTIAVKTEQVFNASLSQSMTWTFTEHPMSAEKKVLRSSLLELLPVRRHPITAALCMCVKGDLLDASRKFNLITRGPLFHRRIQILILQNVISPGGAFTSQQLPIRVACATASLPAFPPSACPRCR